MLNVAIVAVTLAVGAALCLPSLARATLWRATMTPLASIIGSGFLVLGPILTVSYGYYAPLVMAALCGVAWLFGGAIRANIAYLAEAEPSGRRDRAVETMASWVLGSAYVISVAYYLNLFGAFGLRLTPWDGAENARVLTTVMFAVILAVGWTRGFGALERMERLAVGLKLAIIGGLLFGLAVHFTDTAQQGALVWPAPHLSGWGALTLAFGLIVTVQGFETSRYLSSYDAGVRIASMRLAQGIAAAIYMVYLLLLAYAFDVGQGDLTETAIISMLQVVAPVLSILLVVAALSAQFSAALADTGGAGGLFTELTGGRIGPRQAYALLVAAGVALTWVADVFEIISYASRAFALYYAVQAWLAGHRARPGRARTGYRALALLGLAMAIFGAPVE